MEYVLLIISMTAIVSQNAMFNQASKRWLTTQHLVWVFNFVLFLVSFLLFFVTALGKPISAYTVCFGLLFGLVTVVQTACNLMALARGPMHITVLITTSSLVIPSLSGIFISGDSASMFKLAAIAALLFFIWLSADRRGNTAFKPGWLGFTLLAFLCQAAIGVMQKLHQASVHAAETSAFLASALFCSLLFAFAMSMVSRSPSEAASPRPSRLMIPAAIACGVCTYLMNDLNLKLSGVIPSQIFFPVINGGALFLNILLAVLLFREPLNRRQLIGVAGGVLTLLLICILP